LHGSQAYGGDMARELLPDFQKYLLSRRLVAEKNVSFYAWWVRKYLSFANRHEGLSRELKVEQFLDELVSKEHVADWQVRQAKEALQLYTDHFAKGEKETRLSEGGQSHEPKSLAEVVAGVRQVLPLE
jgi:hypothetical protein